ncbi:MAG: hypothetical protein K0S71_2043 [Clostridia bacterium]|jgi:hypothetical protein|nr:hypothetical protein [Clostridia bacterium]
MKKMKYTLLVISLFIFVGCGKADLNMERIDIKGNITSVTLDTSIKNKVDSLLVEATVSSNTTTYDKASVKITKNTVIIVNGVQVDAAIDYLGADTAVEIQFIGPVAESYPVQATADIIRILSPTANPSPIAQEKHVDPLTEAYLLAIDTFYAEDPGLNGDIKYLAIDTTKIDNLNIDSKKELLSALEKYNLTVMDTTFEDLQAEGLIKDLYFEEGILFRIEDEPMTDKALTLRVSKWRSGTGAIGTDKMVFQKIKGTWKITEEGGRWIS